MLDVLLSYFELNGDISLSYYWPLGLLPLPFFVYLLSTWIAPAEPKQQGLITPFNRRLQRLSKAETNLPSSKPPAIFKVFWLALIWLLMIIAVCQPISTGEPIPQDDSARDMMLAVDISGSMEEMDMVIANQYVDRLTAVKLVVSDFLEQRKGDRVGLILFADAPYVQAPLTYDLNTVSRFLTESQIGFAGQGTAIGDAIGLALKRLVEKPNESRTLVLMTDGESNAGNTEPLEAARLAAEEGVKIYTVGIGATSVRETSLLGFSRMRNPSRSLDESTLQEIARLTGGQYFRATDTDSMTKIYTEIDKLEQVEQEALFFIPTQQLFQLPLGIAWGILLLGVLLSKFSQSIWLARFDSNGSRA